MRRSTTLFRVLLLATALLLAASPGLLTGQGGGHPGWLSFHVKGRVLAADGTPISGATLAAYGGSRASEHLIAGVQRGSPTNQKCTSLWEIPPVTTAPDGSYDLVIWHEDAACGNWLHDNILGGPNSQPHISAAKDGWEIRKK
jgi:hypothetical protein